MFDSVSYTLQDNDFFTLPLLDEEFDDEMLLYQAGQSPEPAKAEI